VDRLTLGTAALALTGCTIITDSFQTNGFSGDPYPIAVDTSSGGIAVGFRQTGRDDRVAVLDLLSPLSVVDPGPTADPEITTAADFTILGKDATGALALPRAHIEYAQLVFLHPCGTDDCTIGPTATPLSYKAIIGADSLAGDAVRLRLADDQIFILPDIAGDERHRTFACDAVFQDPYRGGGTMVIGGTELTFDGRRVTLQACLEPDPDQQKPQSKRGTDLLVIASTGIGMSMFGEATYKRYLETHPTAPPLGALPTGSVDLPSGTVTGHVAHMTSLALVAATSAASRAPCRQVYAHHLLAQRDCTANDDCPCEDHTKMCGVPAIVEEAPAAGLSILIVPDGDPTLQALRTELRPDQPEVDGIIGTDVMRELELDIDYPHDRVLARCTGAPATCATRPELYQEADRESIVSCIGAALPVGP
jgi:hypothetical protein